MKQTGYVVLVTAGHGKVRAVAKGIRRTKSRIGGRLEPLSHVDLLMYEGRELDIVSQAETIEPWRLLHEDLTCLAQGLAMAEATEQVAQEREPSECPVPHAGRGVAHFGQPTRPPRGGRRSTGSCCRSTVPAR